MNSNNLNILYVEDNEDYIDFVKRAFKKNNIPVNVHALTDGHQVIDGLKEKHQAVKSASLVLLDIHMPGINGIDLLKRLRDDEDMKLVPVIMFSTSDNPADVEKCYSNGANAYVVKPMGFEKLTQSISSLCNFWLNHNYSKNLSN